MTPNEPYAEQARALYETIRLMRMRIVQIHTSWHSQNGGNQTFDLTLPQMHCLTTIREREHVSIKELAEALCISPPSASTMVDRLVDMGALSREQSPRDRREVVIRLTNQGQETVDAVERHILRAVENLLRRVGPDCAQKWCEVYEKIQEVLLEEPGILLKGAETEGSAQ